MAIKMKKRLVCILLYFMAAVWLASACKTQVYASPEKAGKKENSKIPYQYNVASISKTFTAVAVMKLVEEGKIDLDEAVVTYMPEFEMADERYRDITVRMLLDHTSGIMGTHYLNGTMIGQTRDYSKSAILDNLKTEMLKANPGAYAVYCNDGYILAERLVEKVSGMPFSEYLEEKICKPLGMEQTTDSFTMKKVSAPKAQNYYLNTMKMPMEEETESGSGGIKSTTEDLCKLGEIFTRKGRSLLSEESVTEMMKNAYADTTYMKVEGENSEAYGLGFDGTELFPFCRYGIKAVSKGGDLAYQHGNLMILPEQNMVSAVSSVGGNSTFDQMVSQAIMLAALEVDGMDVNEIDADAIAKEYEDLTSEKIPDDNRNYEGYYSFANDIAKVEFVDDETLRITLLNVDKPTSLEYHYTSDGWFTGELGKYIFVNVCNAETGKTGISKIKLCEEADGTRYIAYNSYVTINGIGTEAMADRAGVKLEDNVLSDAVLKTWEKRMGQSYFLVNADYCSQDYCSKSNYLITLKDSGKRGYIKSDGDSAMHLQRIIDESTSKTAMISRDMSDVQIFTENNKEYLYVKECGGIYVNETAVETLPLQKKMRKENTETNWYHVAKEDEKKQVQIKITGNANVYVYDSYKTLVYATMMENAGDKIVLPKEGYIAFAGETGSSMQMIGQ